MRYRHQPLPSVEEGSTDPYIRLLVLHPGGREGRITCTLKQTRLSQAGSYEALSYCWGKAPRRKIYVNPASAASTREGRYLLVPASLVAFLYRTRAHPRFKDRARVLWVDSVCINQEDNHEKDNQVLHMRDIYMRAEHTDIWLGEEADRSPEALKYIYTLSRKLIYHFAEKEKRALSPESEQEKATLAKVNVSIGDPALEAMFALLERPYFERVWIVQEAVVSPTAHVIVGDNSQTWTTFICAYLYLFEVQTWIFEFYPSVRLSLLVNLVRTKTYWDRKVPVEWWITLISHRETRSGLPEDKIFAMWGLGCKEQLLDLGIRPTYDQSVEKTYWDLAFRALGRGAVEVLYVPRIRIDNSDGMNLLKIPSWVPDWRYTPRTAHPFVILEVEKHPVPPSYAASSTSVSAPSFQELDSETCLPKTLVLKGYTIAHVTCTTPDPWTFPVLSKRPTILAQARVLQFSQAQIVQWESVFRVRGNRRRIYKPTQESYSDVLCKVLVAGLVPREKERQAQKAYAAFESRQRILRIITDAGLGWCLWIYAMVVLVERGLREAVGYRNPEFDFRAMVSPMQNRKGARLRLVTEEVVDDAEPESEVEYLALVPGGSEVGDEVVLCAGVRLPLVLRKRNQGKGERGATYEFLGVAYMHGAMGGELWRGGRSQDVFIE